MLVRIRLETGQPIQRKRGKNRSLALGFAALLVPVALMAYALGFWRLASDLGLAGEFSITGMFSHWQVWIAMAVLLHLAAVVLNRYGRGGVLEMPRALNPRLLPLRPPEDATPRPRASRW
jgi:hypothetical protein